eukprot:scaffold9298_cov93-Isochrysis_galbana.AAC.1
MLEEPLLQTARRTGGEPGRKGGEDTAGGDGEDTARGGGEDAGQETSDGVAGWSGGGGAAPREAGAGGAARWAGELCLVPDPSTSRGGGGTDTGGGDLCQSRRDVAHGEERGEAGGGSSLVSGWPAQLPPARPAAPDSAASVLSAHPPGARLKQDHREMNDTERTYRERDYHDQTRLERNHLERKYIERNYLERSYLERSYLEQDSSEPDFLGQDSPCGSSCSAGSHPAPASGPYTAPPSGCYPAPPFASRDTGFSADENAPHAAPAGPSALPILLACDARERLVVQVRPYGHRNTAGGRAAATRAPAIRGLLWGGRAPARGPGPLGILPAGAPQPWRGAGLGAVGCSAPFALDALGSTGEIVFGGGGVLGCAIQPAPPGFELVSSSIAVCPRCVWGMGGK